MIWPTLICDVKKCREIIICINTRLKKTKSQNDPDLGKTSVYMKHIQALWQKNADIYVMHQRKKKTCGVTHIKFIFLFCNSSVLFSRWEQVCQIKCADFIKKLKNKDPILRSSL